MSEDFNWADLLKKASAASFDPVPVDRYHVSVCETDAVKASTGAPMIKVKLNIEDGPFKNRKIFHQLVVSVQSEVALAIFFSHLKAFGIGPEFLATCPPGNLAPIAQALMGKHAIANVVQEEWQNQLRNKVKGYAPLVSGVPVGGGAGTGATASLPGLPGLPGLPPAAQAQPQPSVPASTPVPATALPGLPANLQSEPPSKDASSLISSEELPF